MWNIFSKNLKIADTRSVQTDGPPVYPCLPAAPLSRSVESYLSDIPPIQEAQAWPSLLYVEWILQWILNIAILNCEYCNAAPWMFHSYKEGTDYLAALEKTTNFEQLTQEPYNIIGGLESDIWEMKKISE